MIVVGIETSTPQTSVAIGTEREILGAISVAGQGSAGIGDPCPGTALSLDGDRAIAGRRDRGRASGPACSPGSASGIETAKTLAQVLARADRRDHQPRRARVLGPPHATS